MAEVRSAPLPEDPGPILEDEFAEMVTRTAPEILRDVLYETKVAAANLRKANGGLTPNQEKDFKRIFSNCTTHQKTKIVLDTACALLMQPQVLGRLIEDAIEDSKEGKNTRLGLLRALINATPKELNVDIKTTQGVIMVPVRSASAEDWQKAADEQRVQVIEGSANALPWSESR